MQRVDGYQHTFVSGVSTFEDGVYTGATAGPAGARALTGRVARLVRGSMPRQDAGCAAHRVGLTGRHSDSFVDQHGRVYNGKAPDSASHRCMCHRSPSAATSSAGPPMRRCRSSCWTRSSRPGSTFIDTADVYSRWHPGNSGGESETIIGNWLKARGDRDKIIIATKLGIEMAPGKKGLSRAYMKTGGRGFVAAAADRLHRPVSVASRRSGNADRGNPVRLCRPDQAGQGAGDRRIQLLRRPAGGVAEDQHRRRACRAIRACSRNTAWWSGRSSRDRWKICA